MLHLELYPLRPARWLICWLASDRTLFWSRWSGWTTRGNATIYRGLDQVQAAVNNLHPQVASVARIVPCLETP